MTKKNRIKAVLLVSSSMTVMAGAIIAPSLTDMAAYFNDSSYVHIKLIISMPAQMIALFGTLMRTLSDKMGRKKCADCFFDHLWHWRIWRLFYQRYRFSII